MKYDNHGTAASVGRTTRGEGLVAALVARLALPITVLSLVAAALLAAATLATAAAVVPTTVPVLLVGWVASVGLAFALPLAVVRGVVAALERFD
ncbi:MULTISPECIES: hypothetical protein [Halorussus]|uniref:hypothetical protein n=1 Tax=Halorussus TaxID=1070314 RepID=UPI00209E1582|nr:hypothetical protein [Halorussus vallis]USZ77644.1 hypothetical protein NGM07_09975 [Halorussus vallis]